MLVLAASLALSSAAALQSPPQLNGMPLRKVQVGQKLPFVYEVDLLASDGGVQSHDPLSSCYWPAAAPLAALVAQTTSQGESCVELGCGTGLCSLTVVAAGGRCLATDVSQVSLELTKAAAQAQALENLECAAFDATDMGVPLPAGEVLILSDVFVTDLLARAYAERVAEAVAAGFRRVLVVDPGRTSRATFLDELSRIGVSDHPGFQPAADCLRRASCAPIAGKRSTQLLFLDTDQGIPVSYDI